MAKSPGVLYVLCLVNTKTNLRECLKIGITKGKSYKAVATRAKGFGPYEHRVLKVVKGTLLDMYILEQKLHEKYKHASWKPAEKFDGHTECFHIDITKELLLDIRGMGY